MKLWEAVQEAAEGLHHWATEPVDVHDLTLDSSMWRTRCGKTVERNGTWLGSCVGRHLDMCTNHWCLACKALCLGDQTADPGNR